MSTLSRAALKKEVNGYYGARLSDAKNDNKQVQELWNEEFKKDPEVKTLYKDQFKQEHEFNKLLHSARSGRRSGGGKRKTKGCRRSHKHTHKCVDKRTTKKNKSVYRKHYR